MDTISAISLILSRRSSQTINFFNFFNILVGFDVLGRPERSSSLTSVRPSRNLCVIQRHVLLTSILPRKFPLKFEKIRKLFCSILAKRQVNSLLNFYALHFFKPETKSFAAIRVCSFCNQPFFPTRKRKCNCFNRWLPKNDRNV